MLKRVAHLLSYLLNEPVEEHYKQETRDLLSTIKKLQDENRKLASSLAAATERDSAFSEDGELFNNSSKEGEQARELSI